VSTGDFATTAPGSAFSDLGRAAIRYQGLRLTLARVELGERTRAVFERMKFERSGTSYREATRKVVHESEEFDTPFLADGRLDADELSRFLSYHQDLAGLQPAEVDAGTLTLTSRAGRAPDAVASARSLADDMGHFISVGFAADSGGGTEIRLSGDSVFVSNAGTLPLYEVPTIRLDLGSLGQERAEVEAAVRRRIAERGGLAGPLAVAWSWSGEFSARRLDSFCSGLHAALAPGWASERPLVLLNDADLGGLAGLRLRERTWPGSSLISLDGVTIAAEPAPDKIDIGRFLTGTGTVPVALKLQELPAPDRRKPEELG
jgi:ethanolamine utilization protein EutA (predicted chaperonin)